MDEFGDAFCYGADADHSSDTSSELECSEFDDSSHECESGLVSLKDKLTAWALDCDVPKTTVGALLRVLKPYHPELPIDASTLVNTRAFQFRQKSFDSIRFSLPNRFFRFDTICQSDKFAASTLIFK